MPVNFELITVAAPPTLPKPPCASPAVLPETVELVSVRVPSL